MPVLPDKFISELNKVIVAFDRNTDAILNDIDDSNIVLIGEATHGTKEFYEVRANITQQLILKKGFNAIAIECDWPAAHPIHQYIQGQNNVDDWSFALREFNHFPHWMWSNEIIPSFIQWLRTFNDRQVETNKVNFFGLDLYSLYASINAVIKYLETIDPSAAERARARYSCFDRGKKNPQEYSLIVSESLENACINEVIAQLDDLAAHQNDYIRNSKDENIDAYFNALQNSRLVKNAEKYYRVLFTSGSHTTWNIRDQHMAETVVEVCKFLETKQKKAKIVIWAHNSHIGDARATEMGNEGELNIGQLLREKFPYQTYHIGFSTFEGTVTAADAWGDFPKKKKLVAGFHESYEAIFHELKYSNFILFLRHIEEPLREYLLLPRLQRAVGVIYRPDTERYSHYFFTHLLQQFDCMIHLDYTNALQPILIEKYQGE